MGEFGKRYRSKRDNDGDDKNQRRRPNEKNEKGSDELVVYRILCPDEVIGSVIGKSGKVINSIRQETGAKVKVVDPFPGAKERVITIYCYVKEKEEVEVDDEYHDFKPLCSAQDALLKVYTAIENALNSVGESEKKQYRDKEECHILVPSSQSANIIGKGGVTIKKLRSKTRTNIKVNPKDANDPTHSCALEFDNFLLITGGAEAVKKALFAVSTIMYKFTPREQIPLDTTVPETSPSIIIPSDVPIYPTGGFYPSADSIVPPRSLPPVLSTTHLSEFPGYADAGSVWPFYSSSLPLASGHGSTSLSEQLIVKVLCPSDKIGRVIGKGGSSIKSVRQASGAHIEVDDNKTDRDECVITVTSTESSDDLKSVAVEAVLLLQGKVNDEDEEAVTIRLLVPSKVIGCIIGKAGSIINEIRKKTKTEIRISKGEKPKRADANDELIEVVGEVSNVRDALVQIVLRLRYDALKDKSGGLNTLMGSDSLYNGSGLAVPPVLPSVPSVNPLGYDNRSEVSSGFGTIPSSSLYGYESLSMRDNNYGSVSSFPSKMYGGLTPPSAFEMLIPANAVGKVIGKGGAVLSNIQKISGATVEIFETKSSRGDRVAHISGTAEQKSTAEKLVQAFMMAP